MLLKKMNEIDTELRRRIDRVSSGLSQALREVSDDPTAFPKSANEDLKLLHSQLGEAGTESTAKERRIGLVLKCEAELCMYEPRVLLEADRIRLEDRFYRLSETSRNRWIDLLNQGKKQEKEYRQLLRHLTYELAESAESFQRLASERASALFTIMSRALTVVVVLLIGFMVELIGMFTEIKAHQDTDAFVKTLPATLLIVLMLAGSLGAMITVVQSVIVEERVRPEYVAVLTINSLIRIAFGSVYAITVVFALLSNLLPLRLNTEGGLATAVVITAIAAGVSDRLFGKVISDVVTGKKDGKSGRAKK